MVLARAALVWERLWPALWPSVGVVGLFLTLALLDFLPFLPGWLHVLILGMLLVALLHGLWQLGPALRWPTAEAARRRLERDSGFDHRPLAALEDKLAAGTQDRAARALWDAHRKRLLAQASRLKLDLPRAGLAKVDPLALRVTLCLLLLSAAVVGRHDWPSRIESALSPRLAAARQALPSRLDVWINPPAYTSLPPLFLQPASPDSPALDVPVGSTVLAQVQGPGVLPRLLLGAAAEDFSLVTPGVYKITAEVRSGTRLAIAQEETILAEWPLRVLPDLPPAIEFISPPGRTERSALRLEFGARDDYGVTKVAAVIQRADQPGGEPLSLELPLPGSGLRDAENSSYHDLTPHPWAGLAVDIRLTATDSLGQSGESDVVRTVLPERIFNHPVARALVALRKELTLAPDKRYPVIRGLAQLNRNPAHFFHDVVVALTLRSAERRLLYDRSPEAVGQVQQLMWDTALRIEEGELAIAERDLRKIQDALMKALAEGASEEEIERLMEQLREALDRFLEALAEQMNEQMAQGMEPQPLPPYTQLLESEDLRQLLDRARELARSGARDAARELLAQLQNMLENLRANPLAQMLDQEGQNAWDMLRDLENLMQGQQELLDRSYERDRERAQQGELGNEGEGQGEIGREPGDGQRGANQMDAMTQEELRQRLGDIMRQLGEMLGDIPRPLGRAERAMRDARDALSREQAGQAIDPQSRALDQLQQGMQAMVDSFMERMGQSQPQRGSGPVGMEPGAGRDPLGRSTGETGLEALEGVEIPDKMELRRARKILNELRKRRSESGRPPIELDYIDRLLQQF